MLEQLKKKPSDLFDSRRDLVNQTFAVGEVTSLFPQRPNEAHWHDLDLAGLREHTRKPVPEIVRAHKDQFTNQFPELKGWFGGIKQKEVRNLTFDTTARGTRFRDTISSNAASDVRQGLGRVIVDASKALPTPHELFDQLLLQGIIRIPPEEIISLKELANCRDPHLLLEAAERIWRYSGLEGIAGDHGYADLENPPKATLMNYHGNNSRAGLDVKSRIAWSDEYEMALVTKTPIAMSNMEANSDLVSSRLALEAGVMPALFSSPREERLQAAREFGRNILITVRTDEAEIRLAKELLQIGSNVHIELANAYSHIGLGAVLQLKDALRKKDYDTPRFVTLGKSVGGAFFIAAALAGVDGLFINRGSSMICSTPTVTGSGIGTWSAVYEVALAQRLVMILTGKDVPYWADAGVNSGADILKALYGGAEGSMVGTTLIRTIDSPPRKQLVKLPNNKQEWRTSSWGDASPKGQRHKVRTGDVAPQGVETTHSIPLNGNAEPVTIMDVANRLVLEIKAGAGDAYVESVSDIPIQRGYGVVRFPEEGALLELKAKETPISGEVLKEINPRVGEDISKG